MKILFIADQESKAYWDYFDKETFKDIDLIVSGGDLKPAYLSFLVTMTGLPVLYICGNHDDRYEYQPPDGCICIEDDIYEFKGVRILGLGGSYRYKPGKNQYTESEMRRRISKLWFKLLRKRGFDILVTHAPAYGLNDGQDLCHQGFRCFLRLLDRYKPKYFVHAHVHMNYGREFPREDMYKDTKVINAYNHYTVEIDK